MVRCYQAMVAATEPDSYGREDQRVLLTVYRTGIYRPQRSPTLTAGKTARRDRIRGPAMTSRIASAVPGIDVGRSLSPG